MPRWLRILLIVLVVIFGLGFGAMRHYLGREAVPETSDYVLDLGEIRRLASSIPGAAPIAVNHEQVAEASVPEGAVFAGRSLRTPHPMTHGAYQVVYPDGFVLIDSAFDADALHVMNPGVAFSTPAWGAIQRALAEAKKIVITHEHPDHIGGIARFEHPEKLVGRLVLNKEQLGNGPALTLAKFPDALAKSVTPIEYERYYALAPGVVLIRAPGHTPGSQLVYVRLESGQELLFVGDVAWHMDQIRELWYRPRLVTDVFIGENRHQVLNEFRTLHDLAEREPSVLIVVSHDVDERKDLISRGVLGDHFKF
jgi:glyoxylase-like metal-dependent hydrolase (beta-lactamase superfamily II)